MTDRSAFADVRDLPGGGFSLPELKWRELVFIGALREEREGYLRDPTRPLPPFEREGLFPEGRVFAVERREGRVWLIPRE
jgi:hypothetical protein